MLVLSLDVLLLHGIVVSCFEELGLLFILPEDVHVWLFLMPISNVGAGHSLTYLYTSVGYVG